MIDLTLNNINASVVFFRPDHEMVKFPVKSAVTTGYH